jgi:hypothetical protein
MKFFTKDTMKYLTFPDCRIEKMEFSPKDKMLKIFVDGGWLDRGKGIKLNKGALFFCNWDCLSVNVFNPFTETWSTINNENFMEDLEDLCEVSFHDDIASLSGFGARSGQWIEWKIVNSKMQAEFED